MWENFLIMRNFKSVKRMFANMEFFIKVVQYGKFKRKIVRCVTASTMG